MAQPTNDRLSEVPHAPVNCPQCGTAVTAEPSEAGDKGVLFRCPKCGKMFGIVPGISEAEQGLSTP
jgi:predicted Zn finger-like uncharacterized protein